MLFLACGFGKYVTVSAQQGFKLGMFVMPQRVGVLNETDAAAHPDTFDYRATYGIAFGLKAGYAFHDHWFLQIEPMFSGQGQDNNYVYRDDSDAEVKVLNQLSLNYFKLPLLIGWNTDPRKKVEFAAAIGGQYGYLVGGREQSTDNRYRPYEPPFYTYVDFPERLETLNRHDWSAVLQAGIRVRLRYNLKMETMVRFDWGFSALEDREAAYTLELDGDSFEVPYYSTYTESRFTDERGDSNNATLGIQIGFVYTFIPDLKF